MEAKCRLQAALMFANVADPPRAARLVPALR
jgi:hypothetical protein